MNRGVWVGAVILGLGASLPELSAQQNVWRPVVRPAATPFLPELAPMGAALGRPVPVARGVMGDDGAPRAFSGDAPIAAGAHDLEIIARAGPVRQVGYTHAADGPEAPDFVRPALTRVPDFQPVPPAPARGEIVPIGNWVEKYPILGPPPAQSPQSPEGPFAASPPSPTRFYLDAEYLLWFGKHDKVPPLFTTGNSVAFINGLPSGALGRADTQILFAGALDRDPQSGGRFTAGYWLDDCKAIEVSGFFLGQKSAHFSANTIQFPVISRPFFDLQTGLQSVQQVSFPNRISGTGAVTAPSQLWGLEANERCLLCCGCDYRINGLLGARYLDLRESVLITENTTFGPQAGSFGGVNLDGANAFVFDRFATHNHFYGGQVGAEWQWRHGRWAVDVRGKLALGVTHEELDISGGQLFTNFAGPGDPRPGGLLALGSNIGHFTKDRFSVVPEVGVNLGYYITENLRAYAGYNFLYWSNVARPGDQIDTTLDSALIPRFPAMTPTGQNRPAVLFKQTDYWAQGLVFGVELKF
jgi:hypothetical protein